MSSYRNTVSDDDAPGDDTPSVGLARRSSVQLHSLMMGNPACNDDKGITRIPDYYKPLDAGLGAAYGIRPLRHGILKFNKALPPDFQESEALSNAPDQHSSTVAAVGVPASSPSTPAPSCSLHARPLVVDGVGHKSAFYKDPKFIVSPPLPCHRSSNS